MADKTRAERLLKYYLRLIGEKAGVHWDSDNDAEVEELVSALLVPVGGTPGTGACICQISPEYVIAQAKQWNTKFEAVDLNMLLDHRCAHHGEKAQPALWGRHKEHVLIVTPSQWKSLGVTRP